jgi:hypothetical protein
LEVAVRLAIEDWVARNPALADDSGTGEKYFVNEALDQLIAKQHK